jgi:hypothetical protein
MLASTSFYAFFFFFFFIKLKFREVPYGRHKRNTVRGEERRGEESSRTPHPAPRTPHPAPAACRVRNTFFSCCFFSSLHSERRKKKSNGCRGVSFS